LLKYQRQIKNEIILMPITVNFTEEMIKAQNNVKGKSFQSAIYSLVVFPSPIKVETLRREALERLSQDTFDSLFPSIYLDSRGRTIFSEQDEHEESTGSSPRWN